MKEYSVRVTVRNNLLLSAITHAGYRSQADFARTAMINAVDLNALVAMRRSPIMESGEFCVTAKLVMEALGAAPSDLWTDDQLYTKIERNSKTFAVSSAEIKGFIESESLERLVLCDASESVDEFEKIINTSAVPPHCRRSLGLTDKEKDLLRDLYAGDITREDLGRKMGITGQRVRQIESKALRKLRTPWLTKKYLGE